MLIIRAQGRLGNQLFQMEFANNLSQKNETIVLIGFAEVDDLFSSLPLKFKILRSKILVKSYDFLFKWILEKIALFGFVTSIKVKKTVFNNEQLELPEWDLQNGILGSLRIVFPCYAQSESFFKHSVAKDKFKFRKELLSEVEKTIGEINDQELAFVHIRRGDYLSHNVFGIEGGISLPVEYYWEGIKSIQSKVKDVYFVFLTDDIDFVEINFKELKNKIISKNSANVDFCLMTSCQHGILSCSSFSWWGAFLANRSTSNLFYYPKYWMGWRARKEYQFSGSPAFGIPIEVGSKLIE